MKTWKNRSQYRNENLHRQDLSKRKREKSRSIFTRLATIITKDVNNYLSIKRDLTFYHPRSLLPATQKVSDILIHNNENQQAH